MLWFDLFFSYLSSDHANSKSIALKLCLPSILLSVSVGVGVGH